MKRRRVETAGEIAFFGIDGNQYLEIVIDNDSIREWICLLQAIDLGFGEVVVVPKTGVKCRIVPIEPESRVVSDGEEIEIALDWNSFRSIVGFLSYYYYNEYTPVNHVDLEISIDGVLNRTLIVRLKDLFMT